MGPFRAADKGTSTRPSVRLRAGDFVMQVACVLERVSRGLMHVAAGLLRLSDWRVMTVRVWQRFHHRDEQVLRGLMSWEQSFFERFIPPNSRVLLVGSGSGRDLIALLQMGHLVVGLEPARPAIETAQRILGLLQLSAEIHEGFIQDLCLPDRFDAIIFSYYCYAYILGTSDRVMALETAKRHLAPGGRILLSYPDSISRSRGVHLTKVAARLVRSDWCPDPNDVLSFPADVRGNRFVQYEHMFTAEEIEREANTAGLRMTYHDGLPDPVAVLEG